MYRNKKILKIEYQAETFLGHYFFKRILVHQKYFT